MPICLRKDTIILDLDNTLIHAVRDTKLHVETPIDILNLGNQVEHYLVFFRPGCELFLQHCFNKYKKVILWSMGTRDYVENILALIKTQFNI
ncbi:MAG: NIF family HAD-type phosphatase, partial [Candidatus Paceibacterota bacterium]